MNLSESIQLALPCFGNGASLKFIILLPKRSISKEGIPTAHAHSWVCQMIRAANG